jgi:hypothetical protein
MSTMYADWDAASVQSAVSGVKLIAVAGSDAG